MIYLLYGPDTYSSRRKLNEIIAAFHAKAGTASGGMGVSRIDAAEDPEAVMGVGRTRSLFAAKELVVIERPASLPDMARGRLKANLASWAKDRNLTVVFWEGDAADAQSLLKSIRALASKTQEFKLLSPAAVRRWLDEEARRRSVRLPAEDAHVLLATHGSDLWALSNDLDKIRHGWSPRHAAGTNISIWDMTDAFLQNRRSAFAPLMRLLAAGMDALAISASLAHALRTLAIVRNGLRGGASRGVIRGLHPFVVKKNTELSRRLDAASLRARFDDLVRADVEFKTGYLASPLPLLKLVLGSRRQNSRRTDVQNQNSR